MVFKLIFGNRLVKYDGTIELVTTPSVLHICSYFITKAFKDPPAKKIISTLLNDVQVIDCDHGTKKLKKNALPQLPVYTSTELLLELASA